MILQLDPPIPVFVVSKNVKGYAIGWIDYSQEHNLIWVVGLDNGEVWSVQNPDIRLQPNYTMGRAPKPA
jgi:hypothetical protein